jgi:hypothetical protein
MVASRSTSNRRETRKKKGRGGNTAAFLFVGQLGLAAAEHVFQIAIAILARIDRIAQALVAAELIGIRAPTKLALGNRAREEHSGAARRGLTIIAWWVAIPAAWRPIAATWAITATGARVHKTAAANIAD